jgi:hypothetical protein
MIGSNVESIMLPEQERRPIDLLLRVPPEER